MRTLPIPSLDCAERGAKVFLVGGGTSFRDGEASVDGFHFLSCSSAAAKLQMGSANILHLFGPGLPPKVNLKNIIISCSSLFIASCVMTTMLCLGVDDIDNRLF